MSIVFIECSEGIISPICPVVSSGDLSGVVLSRRRGSYPLVVVQGLQVVQGLRVVQVPCCWAGGL